MNATHTPGPWQCEPVTDSNPEWLDTPLVRGRFDIFPVPHDDCADANARLIAAAPELLAATERLLKLWEAQAVVGASPDADAWRAIARDCDKARAAIAKARGE